MQKYFKAVGISYNNTPIEVREAVAFDESQAKRFLMRLKEVLDIEEALVLSTCNRTEIYYYAEQDLNAQITSLIDVFHGRTDNPSAGYFKYFNHEEAIHQLFSVSLGLISMVLGDIQIINQVKKSYQWSADENMAGPFLHRLLHTIFFTNKRVVQETPFKDGNASVASSAVGVAENFMKNYTLPRVLIVGLGEIGQNVAENLKDVNAEVTLINRTRDVAENMAAELNFQTAYFGELADYVQKSHVVISAVRADEPLITAEMLGDKLQPKLMIDLSVPRSIEEQIENIPGVLLYNIDQLNQKAEEAIARRKEAISEVNEILEESIAEFENWSQEMEVSPTIKKLKQALDDIRKQELARYIDKLDAKEAKLFDQATKNIIQKVIKLPVLQLKAACKRGEAETLVDVLNDLFNLEKVEKSSE